MNQDQLLPKHGGYRAMRSFQVAQLVYDVTARFCERYIDPKSRTRDQMVQAARSGVQNIAEGSEASATSKKMELKLTQVARASLEELKLDYEDFLRQRGFHRWDRNHPLRQRLVDARLASADEVARWVQGVAREIVEKCGRSEQSEPSGSEEVKHSGGLSGSTFSLASLYAELSANAALTLATVAGYLLDRQVQALAQAFIEAGGFTECLYRVRSQNRQQRGSSGGGSGHG